MKLALLCFAALAVASVRAQEGEAPAAPDAAAPAAGAAPATSGASGASGPAGQSVNGSQFVPNPAFYHAQMANALYQHALYANHVGRFGPQGVPAMQQIPMPSFGAPFQGMPQQYPGMPQQFQGMPPQYPGMPPMMMPAPAPFNGSQFYHPFSNPAMNMVPMPGSNATQQQNPYMMNGGMGFNPMMMGPMGAVASGAYGPSPAQQMAYLAAQRMAMAHAQQAANAQMEASMHHAAAANANGMLQAQANGMQFMPPFNPAFGAAMDPSMMYGMPPQFARPSAYHGLNARFGGAIESAYHHGRHHGFHHGHHHGHHQGFHHGHHHGHHHGYHHGHRHGFEAGFAAASGSFAPFAPVDSYGAMPSPAMIPPMGMGA